MPTNKVKKRNGGFVKTVLIIVIAFVILGYFGFDVRNVIENQQVQENLQHVWNGILYVWINFVKNPFWTTMYFLADLFEQFNDLSR